MPVVRNSAERMQGTQRLDRRKYYTAGTRKLIMIEGEKEQKYYRCESQILIRSVRQTLASFYYGECTSQLHLEARCLCMMIRDAED